MEQGLLLLTIMVDIYCKAAVLKLFLSPMEVPCSLKDARLGPNKQAAMDLSANAHPRPTYIAHTPITFTSHECCMAKSIRTSTGLCYKPTTHE